MKNVLRTVRDRLSWIANSGIPILLALILLAAAAWYLLPRLWAKPPLLQVDGTLYMSPGIYTLEAQEDIVYLGDVSSSIAGHKWPKKDFQANHDITGASVYRRPDGNLAVLEDGGQWYVYRVCE